MLWIPFAFLFFVGCLAAEEPCTAHADGKYYDISPLKASKDYEFKSPEGRTFSINVCRTPVKETFGLKDMAGVELGGVVRRDHGDFAIGKLNTTLGVQDSRPRLTLSDGSKCKTKSGETDIRASTVIEFVCDTSVYGAGSPRLVGQLPPGTDEEACAFFVEWRTSVACPTNEPGGAWGFFAFLIVTILSFALLYLVAGTLYNRFILQLRGIDQIPQFSLESMKYHAAEAFDWLKDMTFVLRSNYGPSAGSGYTPANTNDFQGPFSGGRANSAGINPVSHQTQVTTATSESNNQFVRPHIPRSTSQRGNAINPVSHQAQISTPAPAAEPAPQALVDIPSKKRPTPLDIESQAHGQEFILGDDEATGQPTPEVAKPQPQGAA